MSPRAQRLQPVLWALTMLVVAFLALGRSTSSMIPMIVGAAALAVATLVTVPASSGNRFSIALAVAASMPLLVGSRLTDRAEVTFDVGAAIGAVAVGFLSGWVVLQLFGTPSQLANGDADFLRQSIGAFLFAFTYFGLSAALGVAAAAPGASSLVAASIAALVWFVFETVAWALLTYDRLSRVYLIRLAVQDWPVAFSLFAVGALFAYALPELGWWAPVVALLPYSFAHLAFHRSHTARVTYRQTIRSLARIPEVAGLSPDGHSDRTADLAVSVATELGLNPHDVQLVEFAARLHDIGRITLNELNIIKVGFTDDDIARWGAEIISEAPYLTDVAALVRQQHDPYRRPGERKDPDLPVPSKIIKAASAYDHAINELGFSKLEALEVLHRGAAYDFDPDVVEGIRHVVTAR